MSATVGWADDATVSAVARAICVERFKDRKLTGEPTDADVEQVRHLAEAALRAVVDLRTVADAADVPVRHTRYLGAAHGYVATGGLTPRTSLQAVAEIAAFLRAM